MDEDISDNSANEMRTIKRVPKDFINVNPPKRDVSVGLGGILKFKGNNISCNGSEIDDIPDETYEV